MAALPPGPAPHPLRRSAWLAFALCAVLLAGDSWRRAAEGDDAESVADPGGPEEVSGLDAVVFGDADGTAQAEAEAEAVSGGEAEATAAEEEEAAAAEEEEEEKDDTGGSGQDGATGGPRRLVFAPFFAAVRPGTPPDDKLWAEKQKELGRVFRTARWQHPGARMVLLTDPNTTFDSSLLGKGSSCSAGRLPSPAACRR